MQYKALVLFTLVRYSVTEAVPKSERAHTPTAAARPRRGRRALQFTLVIVSCVLIVDALVGDKGLLAMRQARRDYRVLESSLADLRGDNARLRDEARRLREDPEAIEDLARRELGLIRPGEQLFILRDVPPAGSRPAR